MSQGRGKQAAGSQLIGRVGGGAGKLSKPMTHTGQFHVTAEPLSIFLGDIYKNDLKRIRIHFSEDTPTVDVSGVTSYLL